MFYWVLKSWSSGPGQREKALLGCNVFFIRSTGVMERWSIVENPVSDGGRRGIQDCSAGSQEKTESSKITIHPEVFCSLFLQYSLKKIAI